MGLGVIGKVFGDDSMLNVPSAYFGAMFYVLLLLLSESCCVCELDLLLYTSQTEDCLVSVIVCALLMYIQFCIISIYH